MAVRKLADLSDDMISEIFTHVDLNKMPAKYIAMVRIHTPANGIISFTGEEFKRYMETQTIRQELNLEIMFDTQTFLSEVEEISHEILYG